MLLQCWTSSRCTRRTSVSLKMVVKSVPAWTSTSAGCRAEMRAGSVPWASASAVCVSVSVADCHCDWTGTSNCQSFLNHLSFPFTFPIQYYFVSCIPSRTIRIFRIIVRWTASEWIRTKGNKRMMSSYYMQAAEAIPSRNGIGMGLWAWVELLRAFDSVCFVVLLTHTLSIYIHVLHV